MLLLLLLLSISLAKERFSVKLSNVSAESFALEHNLKHIARVLDYDIFESDNLHLLLSSSNLPTIHHDTKRKLYKRYYTRYSDPLYPSQWHLKTIGETSEYTGRGVVIAIVDDGIQHTHPDIHDNYLASSSWDYNDNDSDPMPYREDGHGTSAAGVAAAVQNNVCGRGVAFKARLAGIRLLGGNVYDYQEAQALTHDVGKINIYSNSWGPQDDGMHLEKPGPVTEAGLKQGYQKGKIYVWAGGNGRQALDRSDYDGYASSRYVIAIGAVDHLGHQAYYSEPGACLFAVAPSSGGQKGITTTDLMGPYGYSQTECTNSFGGTSSAAPLAAGIFAVLLELNPKFNLRDIQHLIYKTRTENSHEMGFGVLNLPRLIEEAKRHVSPLPEAKEYWTEKSKDGKFVIPTKMGFIERVMLVASITHGRRGQLGLIMYSPSGQKSVFSELHNDLHRGSFNWVYQSVRHFGEKNEAGQTWEVKMEDLVPNDNYVGSVDSLQLGFIYF